jgi:hypothetical protein
MLAARMAGLGALIGETIVHHYGRDEFLRRLAHPFWFQSFGAVMGMDWHSSGITTRVIGALKRGLAPLRRELGIHVCGGRGKYSRQTPTNSSQQASGWVSTARRSQMRAAWWLRWTVRQSRMASTFICMASSSRMKAVGPWSSKE